MIIVFREVLFDRLRRRRARLSRGGRPPGRSRRAAARPPRRGGLAFGLARAARRFRASGRGRGGAGRNKPNTNPVKPRAIVFLARSGSEGLFRPRLVLLSVYKTVSATLVHFRPRPDSTPWPIQLGHPLPAPKPARPPLSARRPRTRTLGAGQPNKQRLTQVAAFSSLLRSG